MDEEVRIDKQLPYIKHHFVTAMPIKGHCFFGANIFYFFTSQEKDI